MPLAFADDGGAAADEAPFERERAGETKTERQTERRTPAGQQQQQLQPLAFATAETKERALFRPIKVAVLEHPRHAVLVDNDGTPVPRGEQVTITAVLEPALPGGIVQYVSVQPLTGAQFFVSKSCTALVANQPFFVVNSLSLPPSLPFSHTRSLWAGTA